MQCFLIYLGLHCTDELERTVSEATISTRSESEVNNEESSQMAIHPNHEPEIEKSRVVPTNHPNEFDALVVVPQRKKRSTRQRKKLGNYSLTSDEHIDYVSVLLEKKAKKTAAPNKVTIEPKKQKVKSTSSARPISNKEMAATTVKQAKVSEKMSRKPIPKVSKRYKEDKGLCTGCHVSYGDPCDVHSDEDWLSCHSCSAWFHETCAEDNGVLDDEYFYCKNCLA